MNYLYPSKGINTKYNCRCGGEAVSGFFLNLDFNNAYIEKHNWKIHMMSTKSMTRCGKVEVHCGTALPDGVFTGHYRGVWVGNTVLKMCGKALISLESKPCLLTSRERDKGEKCMEAKTETGVVPAGTIKHPVLVQSTLSQEDLVRDHGCARA